MNPLRKHYQHELHWLGHEITKLKKVISDKISSFFRTQRSVILYLPLKSFVKKEGCKERLQTQMPKGVKQGVRVVGTREQRQPLLVRSSDCCQMDLAKPEFLFCLLERSQKSGYLCKSPCSKISATNSEFL